MISGEDIYKVLSAVVPLYVAMILAYGSVRWWKILTPQQCGGINRFVAIFAVPFLSFHIIASNDPYKMNAKFIAADALQKIAILLMLALWARYSRRGSLEWMITLFMLATLPNTLVMGIPLLAAMYGLDSGSLVVQAVVLQCILWYTFLLFLYEFRSASILISRQFGESAASIVSFKVDSEVMSLDGTEPIETEAEIGNDGKIHVTVRKSISLPPSKAITPRPSNMTGVEIYSVHSSRNLTPRESNFNHGDLNSGSNLSASEVYSIHSSKSPTPRPSNFTEDTFKDLQDKGINPKVSPRFPFRPYNAGGGFYGQNVKKGLDLRTSSARLEDEAKELHKFAWSSSTSPLSEKKVQIFKGANLSSGEAAKLEDISTDVKVAHTNPPGAAVTLDLEDNYGDRDDFSFGQRESFGANDLDEPSLRKMRSSSTAEFAPKFLVGGKKEMPPASVMSQLILSMVWRKLVRNPNTYSSLLGLIWALVSYRWNTKMPLILANSVAIISNAGLGMAMFSLGLFMALQNRLLACGTSLAFFGMVARFITGPAVMAATSIAVGLRGVGLRVSIVQAALPQGIVPFVFAKEYDVHPDVLSTAVIFGMLVALPIDLVYYIFLAL